MDTTCDVWTRLWTAAGTAGFWTTAEGALVWTGRNGAATQKNQSQRLKINKSNYIKKKKKIIRFLPIAGDVLGVVNEGVVKLVELELDLLMEELKEKDCGAGVSSVENLQKVIPWHENHNNKLVVSNRITN